MPTNRHILGLILLLALAGLACRLTEPEAATAVPLTPILPTFAATEIVAATVTDTAVTPTPTDEDSAPTAAQPTLTTLVDLNVRRGPGTNYDVATALRQGEQAVINGRSPDGFWWRIECPNGIGGQCWTSARTQYGTVVNAENVPVAAVPPSPTPLPTETPTNMPTFTPTATATATDTPTATATTVPPTPTATTDPYPYPYP